jgi:hypothetical protein
MHKVHYVPQCPNHEKCVTMGFYTGKILFAYGCGRRVCILHANTLIVQLITEEFESEIFAVAWARTGGRLVIGLENSIHVLVPKDSGWASASFAAVKGPVKDLSWSFFGDLILATGDKSTVWSFDSSLQLSEI